jgi:prolyl-tRNA synthetase
MHESKSVLKKAQELKDKLFDQGYRVEIDTTERRPGEKFYYWEMKGVPLRFELGPKEVKAKELSVFRRDNSKKEKVKEKNLFSFIEKADKDIIKNLKAKADAKFKNAVMDAKTATDITKAAKNGKIARAGFCSIGPEGEKCAEVIEKNMGARILGSRFQEKAKPKECIICGKPGKEFVYIGRPY